MHLTLSVGRMVTFWPSLLEFTIFHSLFGRLAGDVFALERTTVTFNPSCSASASASLLLLIVVPVTDSQHVAAPTKLSSLARALII